MGQITIAIPSWGRKLRLCETILSVAEHSPAKLVSEILLVTCEDEEVLAPIQPMLNGITIPTRVIHMQGGVAAARNMAAKETTTEFICYLDSDCLITHGCIAEMFKIFSLDSDIAAAQASKLDGVTGRRGCGRLVRYSSHQVIYSGYRDLLDTDCLMTYSDVVRDLPFDECYFIGWEDADWSLRVRRAGKALYGVGDATVIHNHSRTEKEGAYYRHRWSEEMIAKSSEHFESKWGVRPEALLPLDFQRITGREPVSLHRAYRYEPLPSKGRVRLHLNENLIVQDSFLKHELKHSLEKSDLRLYQRASESAVILTLAHLFNLPEDCFRISDGATGALFQLFVTMRPYLSNAIVLQPAWGAYEYMLVRLGYNVHQCDVYPSVEGSEPNWEGLERLLEKIPLSSLLVTSSPHMPTGYSLDGHDYTKLKQLVERYDISLVLDQTYAGFCGDALETQVVKENPDLFIVRSMSKLFGLADLRLGYSIIPESFPKALITETSPFSIGEFRCGAMLAALSRIEDFVKLSNRISNLREILISRISDIKGISVLPSRANFVLTAFSGGSSQADEAHAILENAGIESRICSTYGLPESIRITVPPSQAIISQIGTLLDSVNKNDQRQ